MSYVMYAMRTCLGLRGLSNSQILRGRVVTVALGGVVKLAREDLLRFLRCERSRCVGRLELLRAKLQQGICLSSQLAPPVPPHCSHREPYVRRRSFRHGMDAESHFGMGGCQAAQNVVEAGNKTGPNGHPVCTKCWRPLVIDPFLFPRVEQLSRVTRLHNFCTNTIKAHAFARVPTGAFRTQHVCRPACAVLR